jgi:membrane protease YdiL (CAAX protease family)
LIEDDSYLLDAQQAATGDSIVLAEWVPPRPWGVGATLGLSLVSALLIILAQAVGAIPVILYRISTMDEKGDLSALAKQSASDGLVLSASTFAAGVMGVILVIVWSRLRGWSWQDYLAVRGFSLKPALTSIGVLIVILAASYVSLGDVEQQGTDFMVRAYRTAGSVPIFCLALVVVAPIWEELFFRGFMHRGLAHGLGAWWAIVICSASWALMHVQYHAILIFWIFLIGLFFGWVREKVGSTSLVILLHAILNLVAVIETGLVIARLDA